MGDVVPAGAFSAGTQASILRATTEFTESPLRELLRSPERTGPDSARTTPWFQRLAKLYVVGVLAVAAGGFTAWWLATGDLSRAMSVTTAVLIVTCPCAFGIAAPLAYEMVQAGLRRAGLFVRRASFLDRARDVRRVVFDKTGTLTTGTLMLANPAVLDTLTDEQRHALYDLVARSGHPKSAAVREALHGYLVTLDGAPVWWSWRGAASSSYAPAGGGGWASRVGLRDRRRRQQKILRPTSRSVWTGTCSRPS